MKYKKYLKTIGYMGLVAVPCALWINSSLTTKAVQKELRSNVESSLGKLTEEMERFEVVIEEENGNRIINNLNLEITKDKKESVFTKDTLKDYGVSSNIESFDVEGENYFTYTFKKDLTTDLDEVQEYILTIFHRSRQHRDLVVQGSYVIKSTDSFKHEPTARERAEYDLVTINGLLVNEKVNDHILYKSISNVDKEFTNEVSTKMGIGQIPALGYKSDLTYNVRSTKEVVGDFNEYDLNINVLNDTAKRVSTKKLIASNVHAPRETSKWELISDALYKINNLNSNFNCSNSSLYTNPNYNALYTGANLKTTFGFANGIENIFIPGINIQYRLASINKQNVSTTNTRIDWTFDIKFTDATTSAVLFDTANHKLGKVFYTTTGENTRIINDFDWFKRNNFTSPLTKDEIDSSKRTPGNTITFATREEFEKFYHVRFNLGHNISLSNIMVEHDASLDDLETKDGLQSQITSITIHESNERITFSHNDLFQLPKIYSSDYEAYSDGEKVEKVKESFESSEFKNKYNLSFNDHIINTSLLSEQIQPYRLLSNDGLKQLLPDYAILTRKDYGQLVMLSHLHDIDIYNVALNNINRFDTNIELRHIFKVNDYTSFIDKSHSNNATTNKQDIVKLATEMKRTFGQGASAQNLYFNSPHVDYYSFVVGHAWKSYNFEEYVDLIEKRFAIPMNNKNELAKIWESKNFSMTIEVQQKWNNIYEYMFDYNLVTFKINRGSATEETFKIYFS